MATLSTSLGSKRPRRHAVTALALSLVASLTWTSTGGAADSGTPPTHQSTLGGPLHAEMYPSGMEVGPDGSVIVADTGNNQVAKYNAAGVQQWRIGRHGSGDVQFDNPRDAAVDSAGPTSPPTLRTAK